MAGINKRKLLASAQKQIQKGALDKALKDYQTILDADPRDTNVRLKLGDLQLRRDCADEAIAAYLKVADQFMRDGFDAKAVALYKQITKIDPKRHDIYLPLADLYQRLGLVSEAMSSLQTAADAYHREGRKREALDLLRRMAQLDPSNTTSRLKVADLLVQEGLKEEALAEYEGASTELEGQGDWEARIGVLERILEIAPEHVGALEALARIFLDHERVPEVEPLARKLVAFDDNRPEFHGLLAEALAAQGRTEDANESFRKQAACYRERGDDDRAREIMQRHFTSELSLGEAGGSGADPFETDASPFGTEGLGEGDDHADAPELELSALDALPPEEARRPPLTVGDAPTVSVREPTTPVPAPPVPAPPVATTPGFGPDEADADVEQLLAEAAVYLRYGKQDRALETLRRASSVEPESPLVLEKLGEALLATGDADQAVDAWVRGAKAAADDGDTALFEGLRARIQERDAGAAAAVTALMEEATGGAADAPDEGGDPVERAAAEAEAPVTDAAGSDDGTPDPGPAPGACAADEDGEHEIEIDIDDDALDVADTDTDTDTDAEADETPADDLLAGLDEDDAASTGTGEHEAADAPASSSDATPLETNGVSVGTARSVQGELEEADFYFEQGMLDEARAAYERVLELAPSHPGAQLRLGEIAAARGEDPGAGPAEAETSAPDEAPELDDVEDLFGDDVDPGVEETPVESAASPEAAFDGPAAEESLLADEDVADGEPETPVRSGETAGEPEPAPPAATAAEDAHAAPAASSGAEQAGLRGGDVFRVSSPQDESFDLAAELSDALADEKPAGSSPSTDGDGFDSIFREFKRGVSESVSAGDVQTHFDLGIAYREMGLLDDAIHEFRQVLASDERRMEGLHLMGLCALELDRAADAVSHLEQALSGPEVPADQEAAVRFDLARAYEAAGDAPRALDALRRVAGLKPGFQDVEACIERLEAGDDTAANVSHREEEAYESFDDLVAGEDAPATGADDEGYVGFDDVIAEVEREDAAEAEPEPAAGPETEPESAEPETSEEPGQKGGRRRRKVSFV